MLLQQIRHAVSQRHPDHLVLSLQLEEDQALDDLLLALGTACQARGPMPLTQAQLKSASISDLLSQLSQRLTAKQQIHLLIDGLETRHHLALIHYLIQGVTAFSGQVRLYLAVDNFIPQLPSSLFLEHRHLHLDMQDLRINRAELRALLTLHQRQPSDREITLLLQKTDGVPAAIALLLANQDKSAAQQCRLLSQWIEDTLLHYLDPMEFLRLASLSLLPDFNIDQASQLIGVPALETRNWLSHYIGLIVDQNENTGRYQWSQLMQPFFFNILMERYRDLLPNIFARAAPWLLDENTHPRCLDYIIHSIKKPWASAILLQRCQTWYCQREATEMLQLIEQIPKAWLETQASLMLYYCWALIVLRRIDQAKALLHSLESQASTVAFDSDQSSLADNITVLNHLAWVFSAPRPSHSARAGLLEQCLDKQSLFQGEVLSLYANMLHAVGVSDLSKNALRQAITFHESNGNLPHLSHARMLFWQCEFNEGRTQSALGCAEQHLLNLQQQYNLCTSRHQVRPLKLAIAMTKTGLADFLYERNELERAKRLYLEAIPELLNSDWTYASVVAQVGLTRLYFSEGSFDLALKEINAIKERIRNRENTSLDAILCFEHMRIIRAQGKSVLPIATEYNLDVQHLSVESLFMDQYSKERLHWIKCYIMMLLEQNNYTSALIYAVKGLIKSLSNSDNRCRVLFSNVKALCEHKLGQTAESRNSMNISMQLVQQHHFLRALYNDDFGWSELWKIMDQRQEFATEIVPSFLSEVRPYMSPARDNADAINAREEPRHNRENLENSRKLGLTDKEYEILKLLAEGLCNKTIASRSEIALTTVKWHLQNIFGKLQARNRTEAVVKAQEHAIVGKS